MHCTINRKYLRYFERNPRNIVNICQIFMLISTVTTEGSFLTFRVPCNSKLGHNRNLIGCQNRDQIYLLKPHTILDGDDGGDYIGAMPKTFRGLFSFKLRQSMNLIRCQKRDQMHPVMQNTVLDGEDGPYITAMSEFF